ncbi:hypothetical protein APA_4011 [Pseudanabaena sp. lw0831]|uniref:hypothetical protein n=1 Tax=Pseudanabaena sp. lw0831 TaxID=1357935 RepID=UPI001916B9D6|nr:hypothetical protein [Pseudanabaena sp. lw0831]GBO55861.1 hypothetical protein APA_4011 [Pseudanabaena sp. lw0831]
MADPLTLTAGAIANLAFQKFIESGAGELAKKFTTEAIAKMDELRQAIWNKLRGKSVKVDEALAKAEQGDRTAMETLIKNLDVAMDEDDIFAKLLQRLAQEVKAGEVVQVGLYGVTANRVAADIVQDAQGDGKKTQVGARDINATGDAVFKIRQNID